MLLLVMASRRSSIPTKARSSPARPSPACSPRTPSPSAWTEKAPGGTTSSSSGYGAASNTRRSICEPTKPSARREARLVGISTCTTDDDLIRVLTTAPRIKPTSIFLRSARRPNPGRRSTYQRGICVQTTGTSSVNSFKAPEGEGLNFAVSVNDVKKFLLRSYEASSSSDPSKNNQCKPKVLSKYRSADN